MLTGVQLTPLKRIADQRGVLMHMLREDDPVFQRFGEVYFSGVHFGAIKAWRKHRRSTSNLAVPIGAVKLVLFDDRPESATMGRSWSLELNQDNYQLVTIPPGIWTGWQGTAPGLSLVANCASEPHDPAEIESAPSDSPHVPYRWHLSS